MPCHFKTCSVAKDRLSAWRVNERRRAFVFIGYPMACRVAGPQGTRYRPMGTLERLSIQNRAHTHTHTYTGAGWNYNHKSHCAEFLGAFAELRKATICFVMSASLSVRTENLGSHWMIFHVIWYFSIFRKSVEKNQVLVKSYKKNGYFTWRATGIYDHTSLRSSQNEKRFRLKLYRKSKHTFYVQ